jgi:hypothetical protein
MEKETEGSGYFEVDDAKRKDGRYDIKLHKDFKMVAMTRDCAGSRLVRNGPRSDVRHGLPAG